jgi:hypothetical protein
MENRRQHYRHEFAPTRRFLVRLEAAQASVQAEVINLSTSGFCVYSPELRAATPANWVVTLTLETEGEPLKAPAERVYARDTERACCGFRFLSTGPEADEEREKAIWRFLLREQRRRWQLQRGA